MSLTQNRNSPMQNKLVITTAVPVDDQFSSPKQIRWSAALGKVLMANSTTANLHVRNANLSFQNKAYYYTSAPLAIDSYSDYIYIGYTATFRRFNKDNLAEFGSPLSIAGTHMIDASGDPDYVYVTSNKATDGHGVRKVRKSDMTVVASLLATGAGDGQFNNPMGIKYYNGYVYVCDLTNKRIVRLDSDLTNPTTVFTSAADLYDLDTDGTFWYIAYGAGITKKTWAWNAVVSESPGSYSLCIIPDQGDGFGQTLGIVDSTNNHLERRKCSDLSAINSVGSAGDGSSSLCDPQVTGPAGTWTDSEGGRYSVASAANISKNGFSGDFFRGPLNRLTYQPTGKLSDITAIDFNADAIQGEIKNLYKCVNLTSLKLQTNPALVLNLSRLTSKMVTLWAYACGAGISGSIRHMTALASVNLRENGASSAQVDSWIGDLYANKDIMAPGTANFNGSNLAPSVAGKAQADELIATYGWTIAYS